LIQFISQYLTQFLTTIHQFTGNYGWAIIVFAFVIKMVLYYPTQSQYKSMREMQKIQPEVKELQKKFKDKPERMQKEQMALFKRHGVNPLGGCLPLIIQMPILWGIFVTIRKMAEQGLFQNETFLWIGGPLSELYPKWFAGSLAGKDLPLVILYGFSMYLSQKISISDASAEGTQKMMSLVMPIAFTFILWNFPSALLLYWLMFNILSIVQQVIIMKQPDKKLTLPVEETESETESESESESDIDIVPDSSGDEDDENKKMARRNRSRSRKKKGGK